MNRLHDRRMSCLRERNADIEVVTQEENILLLASGALIGLRRSEPKWSADKARIAKRLADRVARRLDRMADKL